MSTTTTTSTTSTRLGAEDWVRAAFEIMVTDGIAGVKIPRLCERLGVTKGSFYWHFADLDAFFGEVARSWGDSVQSRGALDLDPGTDADTVLLEAMAVFADRRNRDLTRAMRDWAQNDARARAAVHRADEVLFGRVKEAIATLGFDDAEAEVRAKILYYSGIGFAHVGPLGTKPPPAEQLTLTWQILTRR